MKQPTKKVTWLSIGTILLVSIYAFFNFLLSSSVKTIGWEVVKELTISVAANMVMSYIKPEDISPDILIEIGRQLAELNEKIDDLNEKQAGFQQLINTLNQMYQEMDQTFTQRQQQMEDHLASIREVQQQLETTTSSEKSVQFPISYQFRPAKDKTGQFQTVSNGSILQSGDTYKVIFTPNETLYVYIFQKDASNQIQRIFPMTEFKGVQVNNHNPVAANKQYILPAKTKSFRLDNTTGTEKIYFIASRYQDAVLENLPTTLTLPETKPATVALFEQTKGFSDIIEDNHSVTLQWQEEQQDMTAVLNTKLESCDGCVNTLTFSHQ
jgi:uncharacterized coiled-coil protein SlyX